MKLTLKNQAQIMQYLRNVAEVDDNDVVANCASQLAVDMELWPNTVDFDTLTVVEQAAIRYAVAKREQYVLLPGQRHAVNLKPVFKARRRIKKVDTN